MEKDYTLHHSHRSEPFFTFVKNGEKTIEGRIRKGKYQNMTSGDHIIIHNKEETESFEVVVREVRTYISFQKMLEYEPLKKVLPNALSVEEGVNIYRQFYSPEEEKTFGVAAIEIERM